MVELERLYPCVCVCVSISHKLFTEETHGFKALYCILWSLTSYYGGMLLRKPLISMNLKPDFDETVLKVQQNQERKSFSPISSQVINSEIVDASAEIVGSYRIGFILLLGRRNVCHFLVLQMAK